MVTRQGLSKEMKDMKFERIYMQSGTNKKADNTDYVDYYRAENGVVIQIVEMLNMPGKVYRVFNNEGEMRQKPNPFVEKYHPCFSTLADAKKHVVGMAIK